MAARGRKPKPRDLKLVEGNPGRRPLPEEGREFVPGELAAPQWIDEKEPAYRATFLAEWGRITRQLAVWGLVGEVNQGGVEALCVLYSQAVCAARSGQTTEARQSFDAYRKGLGEFGLTPATKGRVAINDPAKPKSKAAGYFGG